MLDSKALTKIQSVILIAVIAVAAVSSGLAYVLLSKEKSATIKIGLLLDIGGIIGDSAWKSATIAVEEINAEGGILGRQVELIREDTDGETGGDMTTANSALTRLLTLHKVDFVVGSGTGEIGYMIQDVMAEHKKIFISYAGGEDGYTQRVLDNYDKYKYYFKYYPANTTQINVAHVDELLHIREITGFNKIGYLAEDHMWTKAITDELDQLLTNDYGFDVVYKSKFPWSSTIDFSSYFAAAEAAGVEVLMPLIYLSGGLPFVKEYYDRQSPMIIYGGILTKGAGEIKSWESTDGKCQFITALLHPVTVGYPLTNKTLHFYNEFVDKWGESPLHNPAAAYDIIRFVLPDAIERARTTETEAVIKALDETDLETAMARHFVFTESHDVMYEEGMVTDPEDYGHAVTLFQWQENGSLVPIYPRWLKEEAGATLIFPNWPGPWDNIN